MRRFSKWPIRVCGDPAPALPEALLTVHVGIPATDMPPAVSLLLPTAGGAQDLVTAIEDTRPAGFGLFLADPNLVPARLSRQLARRTHWVCNFPSVGQHEHEFRRYLAEVDLDHAREMQVLGGFRAAGLSIIATVSAVRDVPAARAAAPDALLVVPPVPDFADGSPSLDRRAALEKAIRADAPHLPVIGLRAPGEDVAGLAACLLPPETVSR